MRIDGQRKDLRGHSHNEVLLEWLKPQTIGAAGRAKRMRTRPVIRAADFPGEKRLFLGVETQLFGEMKAVLG
jgi:hypothetical protein